MRSTKFSCERTLFKKDLARFWPLTAVYTVLWFLQLPLNLFSDGERLARVYANYNMTAWAGDRAMETVCGFDGTVIVMNCYSMPIWSLAIQCSIKRRKPFLTFGQVIPAITQPFVIVMKKILHVTEMSNSL